MFTFQKGYIRSYNEMIFWHYDAGNNECALMSSKKDVIFRLDSLADKIFLLNEGKKLPMLRDFSCSLSEWTKDGYGMVLHPARKGQNCLLICSLMPGEKARCPRKSNVFFTINPETGETDWSMNLKDTFGPFEYPIEIAFNICQGGRVEIGTDFRRASHVSFRFTNKKLLEEVN